MSAALQNIRTTAAFLGWPSNNGHMFASWKHRFAVELHPTGEVSEYTATLAYELLREGEEGRQRVDSVKFVLRAEGNNQC